MFPKGHYVYYCLNFYTTYNKRVCPQDKREIPIDFAKNAYTYITLIREPNWKTVTLMIN